MSIEIKKTPIGDENGECCARPDFILPIEIKETPIGDENELFQVPSTLRTV